MAQVMDSASRFKLEETALRQAEAAMRDLRPLAEVLYPEVFEEHSKVIVEILKIKEFPHQRRKEFTEELVGLKKICYQKYVENLLNQASEFARNGNDAARNELLGKAKQFFGLALRHGAGPEFKMAVERRLAIILMTRQQGIDDATKRAATRKLADVAAEAEMNRYHGVERRRAIRYVSPHLVADIGGVGYRTINWSVRGLLLEDYDGPLTEGSRAKFYLTTPGVVVGGWVSCRVVRRDEPPRTLAVDFGEMCTVVVDLAVAMKRQDHPPSQDAPPPSPPSPDAMVARAP
ncbi:PilZ domain-containing protein [Azospirillaceae bacterium]